MPEPGRPMGGGPMGGGHMGGGPMGGGRPPMGGGYGHNFTMTDANSMIDAHRTMGRPQPVSGAAGYVGNYNSFSIFNISGIFKTARSMAKSNYNEKLGVSKFRVFWGHVRMGIFGNNKYARFNANVNLQKDLLAKHDITKRVYAQRIMGEAMNYFGYLQRNTLITEEQYRQSVMDFANANNIDFSFGDEAPARGR